MLLKLQAYAETYENEDGTGAHYGPSDTADELQEATLTDGTSHGGEFSIAPSGSLSLDVGGIEDVRGFWIRASGDFDLTLTPTGADPVGPLPVRRAHENSTSVKARILAEISVTALTVANAMTDETTIRGTYRVWGVPSV